MRILHTSDWHLGSHLGHIDRSADIYRTLRQIAQYLEAHHVEVMLVAGDLFESNRQEEIRASVQTIRDIFYPFLQRGGTILAISGNHDSELFFETLHHALDLVAPGQAGPDGTNATGRIYIAYKPELLRIADHSGNVVQFVLMPYPTPRYYLRGEAIHYHTLEEKHQGMLDIFARVLAMFETQLDPRLPSVLVSHILVRGITTPSHYRLGEGEGVIIEPSMIPTHWAYIACGHIHQPQQAIKGASHVRYSGSIERFDAGERDDEKSVVLCKVGPEGLVGEPECLPLASTPFYSLDITDPETQIPQLAERYPDAAQALVAYTLHWQPGTHHRDELCQAIHKIFPRWYRRDFKEIGQDTSRETTFSAQRMRDVPGTVRDYLQVRLVKHPQREQLLHLAETLLAEEGWK